MKRRRQDPSLKIRFFTGVFMTILFFSSEVSAIPLFINEIHYDNAGGDSGEAVEIAGPAGSNLTGWQLALYNGNGGATYGSTALSGIIPNQQAGFGTLFYPILGIQNGSPDGLALVDSSNTVVQFLSYEGTFTATDGPANGLTSTAIGVSESSGTPVGHSLQLGGIGLIYSNFFWENAAPGTFGALNTNQQFRVAAVPEASQLALIALAFVALGCASLRKRCRA